MARLGLYERKIWKMKKKIKDLTLEELNEICTKYDGCKGCPFQEIDCEYLSEYFILKEQKILEQEIEVEDDE